MQLSVNHLKELSTSIIPIAVIVVGGALAAWYATSSAKPVCPFSATQWQLNTSGIVPGVVKASCPHNQPRLSLSELAALEHDPFVSDKVIAQQVTIQEPTPKTDTPDVLPPKKLEPVTLSIILKTSAGYSCKLNNKLYQQGEVGDYFRVVKINGQGVWLETGDGEVFLRTGQTQNIIAKTMASSER